MSDDVVSVLLIPCGEALVAVARDAVAEIIHEAEVRDGHTFWHGQRVRVWALDEKGCAAPAPDGTGLVAVFYKDRGRTLWPGLRVTGLPEEVEVSRQTAWLRDMAQDREGAARWRGMRDGRQVLLIDIEWLADEQEAA